MACFYYCVWLSWDLVLNLESVWNSSAKEKKTFEKYMTMKSSSADIEISNSICLGKERTNWSNKKWRSKKEYIHFSFQRIQMTFDSQKFGVFFFFNRYASLCHVVGEWVVQLLTECWNGCTHFVPRAPESVYNIGFQRIFFYLRTQIMEWSNKVAKK